MRFLFPGLSSCTFLTAKASFSQVFSCDQTSKNDLNSTANYCTQASLRRIIHFWLVCVKTANNKIPVSSVYNDSERLYGTTVCRCLVRRPHYSARLMLFGSRGPSEFATELP